MLVGYFYAGIVEGVTAGAEAVAVAVAVAKAVVAGSLGSELLVMPDVLNVVALVVLAMVKYHHLVETELLLCKFTCNFGSAVCTSFEKINSILLFVHIV